MSAVRSLTDTLIQRLRDERDQALADRDNAVADRHTLERDYLRLLQRAGHILDIEATHSPRPSEEPASSNG